MPNKVNKQPPADRPRFLHISSPSEIYLNPASIALIVFEKSGNALISMVNGNVMQVEALQWRMMREAFEAGVELQEIQGTGGLVSA